jgi:Tfp pilus assembly protein PilO
MHKIRLSKMRVLFTLAIALFVAGLAIDLGFARPRFRRVEMLREQHAWTLDQMLYQHQSQLESRTMAQILEVEDLAELTVKRSDSDPLVFLGDLLSESGVTRLELTTVATDDTQLLRRTQFSIRITGRYQKILELVRTIEQSPRLATIDAFALESVTGQKTLDGRLNISIYDPLVRSHS